MIIGTVARKEMLDQVSSPKFVVLFIVSTILIVLSLYTGSAGYVGARNEYHSTQALARNELESRHTYDDIARFGVKVARPPAPLSSVAGGLSDALGRSARVVPAQQPEAALPPVAQTPVLAVLGQLDLSVVVRVFLSLFVLLLTYDAVAGEKEAGTLKAILANPVPRAQLLLGKALGLFGTLLVAIAVPALLGLLVMKVGFHIDLTPADWARIGAIGVTDGLYLLALFAIGLLISTLTTRGTLALLVLLLIWVGFVEVIPKASPMIAGEFRPVPSFASYQTDRDRLQKENQDATMRGMMTVMQAARLGSPSTSPADAQRKQQVFDSLSQRLNDSLSANLQAKLADLDEAQRNREQAFTALAQTLARISPAEAMNHAVAALAGTDFASEQRWQRDLVAYRDQLEQFLRGKGVQFGRMVFRVKVSNSRSNARGGGGGGGSGVFMGTGQSPNGRLELGDFPKFTASVVPFGTVVGRAAPDLVILAAYAVVAFFFAFARFMKYDAR